jgi:hypothetical protein
MRENLFKDFERDAYGDGNTYRGVRSKDSAVKTVWVGMTDEEVDLIVDKHTEDSYGYDIWCDGRGVAREIEIKLKERNNG